jgi:hypothetical protein
MRRLNPEISLGFFVASLFWIGIVGWQSSYSPTEKQKDECYEAAKNTGYKNDECKTIWEKTTSDPIALFNLILAFSTVGLWVATISLYRAGERTARRQLRAYVLASSAKAKNFGSTKESFEARVIIRNSGKSPASDVVAWVGIQIGKFPDPGTLGRPPSDLHVSKGVMGPGAKSVFTAIVDRPMLPSELERIRSGSVTVYIFGEIEYLDIFNRKQSSSFRFCYGGPGGENKKGKTSGAANGNRTT